MESRDKVPQNNLNFKYKSENFAASSITFLVGLGFVGICFIFYYFTRPCVIGKCELIAEARHLADEYLIPLEESQQEINFERVQNQLIDVSRKLAKIPQWSQYHGEARSLIENYRHEIEQIDLILEALGAAQDVENMSNSRSLSLDEWRRIEKLLGKAIAILQGIPDGKYEPWLNNKIKSYQVKLNNIQAKLAQEKEANQALLAAQEAAKLGETREKAATSLAQLQFAEATWRTAIERLEVIPMQTTAYSERQELLDAYLPKYVEAQNKRKQAELALNFYNQGIKQAELARRSQLANQWTMAVSHWQNALKSLGQIPESSFQHPEATKLKADYQNSLEQAKNSLKLAVNREKAKNDLNNICTSVENICNYSLSNNSVKVFLSKNYLDKIKAVANQSTGNDVSNVQDEVIQHIAQLETNFKYVSSKYNLPLEVYDPQGNLMIKYESRFN